MSKRVRKPVLPHELRLAKIDGFGRTGKYYEVGSGADGDKTCLVSLPLLLLSTLMR